MSQAPSPTVLARLREVAPKAPPCFASDADWLGWLEQRQAGREYPLPLSKLGKFDPEVPFCRDCNSAFKRRMVGLEKCRPSWLKTNYQVPERAKPGARMVLWLEPASKTP